MKELEVIKELERIVGKKIPKSSEALYAKSGFKITSDRKITGLSLSECQISQLSTVIPSIAKLPHLTSLYLTENIIEDITPLTQLKHINYLVLWRNQVSDLEVLKVMNNLIFLDLTANRVSDISPLRNLVKLEDLYLDGNMIRDISPLKKLIKLETLTLDDNYIYDFKALKNLKNLLELGVDQLSWVNLDFLRNFPNLSTLSISDSIIKDLSALNDLKSMETLTLEGMDLIDIPEISNLRNLESLTLTNNSIEDIDAISKLDSLTYVDLTDNYISDISPLEKLVKLKHIGLQNNRIKDILPLRGMSNLICVTLQNNPISDLPAWITDLNLEVYWDHTSLYPSHSGMRLFDNPLQNPPPEIIQRGKEAIKAWFEGSKKYINEVKVLLVGHGEVGKTTLVKCIKGEEPDPNEPATHYIRISPHAVAHNSKEVKLKFWDFGGQDVMHSTHQFFLSKRSIYILVLDGRKDEDAEYWLKHIESFGGNSPTLVVLNKVDMNPAYDVDRRFLKQKYPFIIDFYKTVCSDTMRGIKELKEGLTLALDQVELLSVPWPTQWLPVKEGLEKMPDDFISQHAYDRLCEAHGITDPISKDTLAGYLNDLGVIVHFKDMRLSDLHILQPRWASRAAYKIINAKVIADNQGLLKSAWLPDIMSKEDENDFVYQPNNFPFILDLMQKFELCYSIRENNEYLIPELLGVQQPELPEHDGPVLRFFFNYDGFIPRSVISRFMVRMHEDIKENLRWRTGVVLADDTFNSMAIVIADIKEQKIKIEVSGSRRREYFAIIRKIFISLHKTFEKLEVSEWIPAPDSDALAIEYEELRAREEAGETKFKNFKLKKTYNVKDLLNGIESEKVRKEQYSWDAFLCYSSRDKDLVRIVAADLRKKGIRYWLDEEQIQPGDNFADKIVEGLSNSRNIIPCISANQLKSGWARKEYQSILIRIINGSSKQKITPLVLDKTSDNDLPLFLNDIRVERYLLKEQYERLLKYLAPIEKKR